MGGEVVEVGYGGQVQEDHQGQVMMLVKVVMMTLMMLVKVVMVVGCTLAAHLNDDDD